MIKTSIPRLHTVRLKSGGATVRVFKNEEAIDSCRKFERDVKDVSDRRSLDMDGYAIVAWAKDGSVSSSMHVRSGRWVGQSEVPDFVRTVLIDHLVNP